LRYQRTVLSVLALGVAASIAAFGAPASAASGLSIVDANGVVLGSATMNDDNTMVTACDPLADNLNVTVEYVTAKDPIVQRRSTTFPGTCTVGFAFGDKIVAIRGIAGSVTTDWVIVG
jgi:hypothetical protein